MSKKTRFTHEMGTVVQFAVGPVTLAEIQIILVIFGAFCRTLNLDEMKKLPPMDNYSLLFSLTLLSFSPSDIIIQTYEKRTGRAISLSKAQRHFGLVIKWSISKTRERGSMILNFDVERLFFGWRIIEI